MSNTSQALKTVPAALYIWQTLHMCYFSAEAFVWWECGACSALLGATARLTWRDSSHKHVCCYSDCHLAGELTEAECSSVAGQSPQWVLFCPVRVNGKGWAGWQGCWLRAGRPRLGLCPAPWGSHARGVHTHPLSGAQVLRGELGLWARTMGQNRAILWLP